MKDIDKILSYISEGLENPLLQVMHLRLTVGFAKNRQNGYSKFIDLAEEPEPNNFIVKFNYFIPMTVFIRRENTSKNPVIGLQQKFFMTIPENITVDFDPRFYYKWSAIKRVVHIEHKLSPDDLKNHLAFELACERLQKECREFYVIHGGKINTNVEEDEEFFELPF